MPIDPDELKVRRVKRESQVQEIQKYMEEQDALDKQNATGKMGHRTVKCASSINKTILGIVNKLRDAFKDK